MGKYDDKRPVSVSPFNGSNVRYGFLTNIDAADSSVLGQQDANDRNQAGLVFGANSPKPARASRKRAAGTTSSFIDWNSIAAARTSGWSIGKASVRRGGRTAKTRIVAVTFQGITYAWNMPNDTYANIGAADLQTLGVRDTDTNDTDLVFGVDSPKPPKATFDAGDNQYTTFYDPTNGNLPEGWSSASNSQDPQQAP
ncbi:MAG: hypothetical protein AAF609_08535 [Cyanobacteria bacterium P01_C01_bin.120]